MRLSLNNSLGKWILPAPSSAFSTEARNYFDRLDTAGDTTYVDYKQPLANYIDSLVSLGGAYWDDMKSSTSFVGVGIQGVTVPLRDGMTVPTQNNFVAGDLDQLTGLKGNGSTKAIATGITTDDAGTINDVSISAYLTEQSATPSNRSFIGAQGLVIRETSNTNEVNTKSRNYGSQTTAATLITGFIGHSRSASASYTLRLDGSSTALSQAATVVPPTEIGVFRDSTAGIRTDARLATYHAGPALDLATLEGLQATLLSEIRTAHTFVAVASYFSRLVAAGDTTHVAYKQPLTNYITSLVGLGGAYWDTMLSATSFVGVGIQGITVPLRDGMTVATNNNFVAGDLNQLTGLKGDASTKYLGMNILSSALSQNDASISVYITEADGAFGFHMGNQGNTAVLRNNPRVQLNGPATDPTNGFPTSKVFGGSRTTSTDVDVRNNQVTSTISSTSSAPSADTVYLYSQNGVGSSKARFATYHFGPALDLATLEGLQDTLITEIAAI